MRRVMGALAIVAAMFAVTGGVDAATAGKKILYEGEIKDPKLAGVSGFKITEDEKTRKKQVEFSESCAYDVENLGSRNLQVVIVTFQGPKAKCALDLPERVFGRLNLGKVNPAGVIQFHGAKGSSVKPVDVDVAKAWRAPQ